MKVEAGLSELRCAVASAAPHMARPNTPAFEKGLGVVRLQLTGHGLLVSATDHWTLATSRVEVDVADDGADPIDLSPSSVRSLLTVFPPPGKDSAGEERILIDSHTASDGGPATVTFTQTGGLFDGDALVVVEYATEDYPNVPTALRGLLARQGEHVAAIDVDHARMHRFEAAAKGYGAGMDLRAVRATPGSDRGVVVVGIGDRFLGAAQVHFPDGDDLPATKTWLDALPGEPSPEAETASLAWTTSTPTD